MIFAQSFYDFILMSPQTLRRPSCMLNYMKMTDFTRFLWLSDPTNPNSELQVYRFKVVLFGTTSSPFMLNATLHHHFQQFESPIAVDMLTNLYVDNVISGCNSNDQAIRYYQIARSS